jgi:hypothetical protein
MNHRPGADEPDNLQKTSATVRNWCLWALIAVPIVGTAALLWSRSIAGEDCSKEQGILAIALWFDPVFFQYNLFLGVVAILIVPTVPLFYVEGMAWRKKVRLLRELPVRDTWLINSIDFRMEQRGRFGFYLGSAALTTVIVTLGISILLLFKPVRELSDCGVVFSKGANMLILGPFIALYTPPIRHGWRRSTGI